jgi:hypothetical protein
MTEEEMENPMPTSFVQSESGPLPALHDQAYDRAAAKALKGQFGFFEQVAIVGG